MMIRERERERGGGRNQLTGTSDTAVPENTKQNYKLNVGGPYSIPDLYSFHS